MARSGNNSRIPAIGSYAQTSAPTFGTDLTELANDVADLIGESFATGSALPLSGNWPGRTAYTEDGKFWAWSGSKWHRLWTDAGSPFAVASGTGSVVFSGTNANFSITLPTGRFTAPPIVTVISRSSSTAPNFSAVATSATNVNVLGTQGGDGLDLPYQWIAVQMTPTSAAG